jgi:hypothetical protein
MSASPDRTQNSTHHSEEAAFENGHTISASIHGEQGLSDSTHFSGKAERPLCPFCAQNTSKQAKILKIPPSIYFCLLWLDVLCLLGL